MNKVGYWAAEYAAAMFGAGSREARVARDWGFITGLWHDLGKFSVEFQERLRGKRERVDHSTAGAQHVAGYFHSPPLGQLLAYLIAGHHAGLTDWNRNGDDGDLSARLRNLKIPDWRANAPEELLNRPRLGNPPFRKEEAVFLARFLFSCLVDADFLATESFMDRARYKRRTAWPDDILTRMQAALENRCSRFGEPRTPVDVQRRAVREACLNAAAKGPGLFTLTVPTGGGKTLSSLAFSLAHAIRHNLRRVIYIIPYTSIIEQNGEEFRETFADLSAELGRDVVLEHHSNFEPEEDGNGDQKTVWQLATENWDAPLVVTTNVQFFESLYSNRTSRCRKLHNIARSVLIFDEAQTLPVEFLSPCLDAVTQLTGLAGCTAILCTATQPALAKRDEEFPVGLPLTSDREIVPDPGALYRSLRRVTLSLERDAVSDDDLVCRLRRHCRVLCIVNTKRHATRLSEKLGPDESANLHLSAQLCPAHRAVVLEEVKRREEANEACRLVATTVVEAGVDIDFPAVYRAMTGLDSFAQAAGRCNRHGAYPVETSRVVLFTPADENTPGFLTQNVNATEEVLPDHDDLLGIDAIERYFRQYYFLQGKSFRWDKRRILDHFHVQNRRPPFIFDFKTAAREFQLIPESQRSVIIEPKPGMWEKMDERKAVVIRELLEQIRESHRFGCPPPRDAQRRLQRYTVQVPVQVWEDAKRIGAVEVYHDRFPILTHPENNYDERLGLRLNSDKVTAFMI